MQGMQQKDAGRSYQSSRAAQATLEDCPLVVTLPELSLRLDAAHIDLA